MNQSLVHLYTGNDVRRPRRGRLRANLAVDEVDEVLLGDAARGARVGARADDAGEDLSRYSKPDQGAREIPLTP